MRKQVDQSTESFVHRHLSQLKVLTRLWEHELEGAKQGGAVTIDRELADNLMDLLEIFVEDLESVAGKRRDREVKSTATDGKATVTRLN